MDLLNNLALGFVTASSLANLFFCLIGVLLGTLIVGLPGIVAMATNSMLLPIPFQLGPVFSLILLAVTYSVAHYVGSSPPILLIFPQASSLALTPLVGS